MSFDVKYMFHVLPDIASYIPVTLKLTLVATLMALPLSLLLAIVNYRRVPVLHPIARVYISVIRGTPVMMHIYVLYNLGPYMAAGILKGLNSSINPYKIPNILFAYIALSMFTSIGLSEAIRAGLMSVDRGQFEAGEAAGLTNLQTYTSVIIPQALGVAMPVLCNTITGLIKSTSLAFIMTIVEVTGRAKILSGNDLKSLEAYMDTFIIYLVLVYLAEKCFDLAERKLTHYRGNTSKETH